MDRARVPTPLQELSVFFTNKGFQVYLVGGAVRDMFLGKEADDWDIATNATPEEVSALFAKRIIPTGIEHGTVTIPFKGHMIECTTFRTEQGYSDGRRPDSIAYAATIEEDLSRRDFTMNAIAVSLPEGRIIDPFGGRADIRAGVIRTVGVAAERFAEDGLRPLRGVRFSSQLGFNIDDATLAAIPVAIPVTAKVACERVREEFSKILTSPVPSVGIRFMEQTGLLKLILPELASCRGVEQKGMHKLDVLDHLLAACDACPTGNLELRLAGLFHDIGKPAVRADDGAGTYTFYNHEMTSAKIAVAVMTRLRYPLKTCKTVEHLVKQHMFHYESHWTDAAVRRFIVRVGPDQIENLFTLRRADSHAIAGITPDPRLLAEFSERIQTVLDADHAFSLRDLAVNGKDLLAEGIPAGPETGHILNELFESVLDDPALNTRDRLLEIARAIHAAKFA
jgi:poly(A) polymerase/tRNA nucleotidyltransferase (CCA-adding enzyme)